MPIIIIVLFECKSVEFEEKEEFVAKIINKVKHVKIISVVLYRYSKSL